MQAQKTLDLGFSLFHYLPFQHLVFQLCTPRLPPPPCLSLLFYLRILLIIILKIVLCSILSTCPSILSLTNPVLIGSLYMFFFHKIHCFVFLQKYSSIGSIYICFSQNPSFTGLLTVLYSTIYFFRIFILTFQQVILGMQTSISFLQSSFYFFLSYDVSFFS